MVKITMIYGERLKETRENLELKQSDLSQILLVSKEVYGNYEREFQIIPLKHLNTICNYLNISFDYAFSFIDDRNYKKSIKDIDRKLAGKRLKEFRKDNKLTQVKLAEMLNTVHPVITNYENGKHLIATPFLYDICKKYNISADYLLGKIDSPKYLK